MSAGVDLIAAERERQIAKKGWTREHDDEHHLGELVDAAIAYLRPPLGSGWEGASIPAGWPFEPSSWKPRGQINNLVRAGALIAAEIDRLHRRAGRES